MKYLFAALLIVFPLASCSDSTHSATNQTAPRDCDQPNRDETGRPVDLC